MYLKAWLALATVASFNKAASGVQTRASVGITSFAEAFGNLRQESIHRELCRHDPPYCMGL